MTGFRPDHQGQAAEGCTRRGRPSLPRGPLPSLAALAARSVIVCSYNGARTMGETLSALERLDFPDYEVIVIDDGSTDACQNLRPPTRCG